MASAFDALVSRLAAAAATVEPGPLLEWQQVTNPRDFVGMRAGFRTVGDVRIRYAASEGPASRTVLFTSPWPESIYAFAPIWPALATGLRLLAVDLPGFGASQARPDLRSPQAMGAFLVSLIKEWDLGRPHLVAPDVGTSAALFAALLSPGSLASVIVSGAGAALPSELGPPPGDSTLVPNFDHLGRLDHQTVVDAALSTVAGYEFPQNIRQDYYNCYAGDRLIESMEYLRRNARDMPALAMRLGEIETPVLVFAGTRDRRMPLADAESRAQRLPNCRRAMIGAGHFVWEEVPEAFAQMLREWIDEHHHRQRRL
jgi:pimeloyl-ACP methyl ester carboxylesterase